MGYDIDGVFVARDGKMEINAELRLCDAVIEITRADGSTLTPTTTIPAAHPAVQRHMDRVAAELHRIAYRRSMPHAVPKPNSTKRRKPVEAIPCPTCHGVEPDVWDCETCDGGGRVKG